MTIFLLHCFQGGTAILHAPYASSVHAIDVSSRMIEFAEERKQKAAEDDISVDNVTFECAGIDSVNVPDKSYDVVLGCSILHLLPNKDEVMKKIHDKLKPSGYFISSTPCLGDQAKFIGWLAAPFSRIGLIPELNVFTKKELRKSMEVAGFIIEREYHPSKDKAVFLVARRV